MILRYIFAHLLFFVTGVGVTVLLMNLLIGILSALMVRIGGALSGTQLYQREILDFQQEDDLGCPWDWFSAHSESLFLGGRYFMCSGYGRQPFPTALRNYSVIIYNPIPCHPPNIRHPHWMAPGKRIYPLRNHGDSGWCFILFKFNMNGGRDCSCLGALQSIATSSMLWLHMMLVIIDGAKLKVDLRNVYLHIYIYNYIYMVSDLNATWCAAAYG